MIPVRFRPILKQYVWGGEKLAAVLGKDVESLDGPNKTCAESWEVCDHEDDQSVVDQGTLVGKTLAQLVAEQGKVLLGRHYPQTRFPLLMKFLDAAQTLSVQVHPDDEQAGRLEPPDLGKTEAWVVVQAEPGSRIYAGLKPGVDRKELAQAIELGRCEECLHQFDAKAGDCVFIPAGTVHALGKGLLVAEIQQASDTTYRLFDWNRLGSDGKPRPLHIEKGLDAINYEQGPVMPVEPTGTERDGVSRLVQCDKFLLDAWHTESPQAIGGDDRFHILTVLEGTAQVTSNGVSERLKCGQTLLLPAAAGQVEVLAEDSLFALDAYLP